MTINPLVSNPDREYSSGGPGPMGFGNTSGPPSGSLVARHPKAQLRPGQHTQPEYQQVPRSKCGVSYLGAYHYISPLLSYAPPQTEEILVRGGCENEPRRHLGISESQTSACRSFEVCLSGSTVAATFPRSGACVEAGQH